MPALDLSLESDDESYSSMESVENDAPPMQTRFIPFVTNMLVRHGKLSVGDKLQQDMFEKYLPVWKEKYFKSKAKKRKKIHDLLISHHIYHQCCENGMEQNEKNFSFEKFQSLGLLHWDLTLVEDSTYFDYDSSESYAIFTKTSGISQIKLTFLLFFNAKIKYLPIVL